ncbi:diguanylate cyclase domain-containing protein [Roseomonas sp. 18066]|uniref:diguanylate cyclase domain-containing protein n=1 Tax=Roseomonas sp. 18066 TaxID=2681412 RepID=UPI00135B8C61|nr:CHASE domain-containing protein [Roseomonas sp. 18066]
MPADPKALAARLTLLRRASRLLILLGLCATLALWHLAARRTAIEADARFREAGLHVQRLVEERTLRALDVIAGFRALFEVGDQVSRADFHRHALNMKLPERFPGVVGIQFAPLVLAAEKGGFEAAVRADSSLDPHGYPDYAIHPAGSRDFYLPNLYNEPMAGNEAAFGHDTTAEPSRRRVMERSRDSGEPVASQPLSLLQGGMGFTIRHAVYRRGAPLWTVEQRRDAFIGQVNGVFRAAEMISPLLRDHLQEYRIRIEDRGPAGTAAAEGTTPQLLFDSQPQPPDRAAPATRAGDRQENGVAVAGRIWQITLTRRGTWPHLAPLPLVMLLGGAALTLAAVWLLHALARHHRNTAALAQRLAHQAQHDALTGLPNRLLLDQRLTEALGRAERQDGRLALIFIDLDRFKAINDTLGHAAGDAMLQAVAARLRHALRPGDTVARLGGDEFVVLLPDLPAGGVAGPPGWGIGERLRLLIGQPVEYAGQILSVGASMGAAHYPEDGRDAATLMHHADAMMYDAKHAPPLETMPAA